MRFRKMFKIRKDVIILPDITSRGLFTIVMSLIILEILVIFMLKADYPKFVTDSWSFFELSKTIFNDFYNINTVRQYQFEQTYSISHPPLWPTMIALFRFIYDKGIYTGYALNILVSLSTLIILIAISNKLFNEYFSGIILYLSFFLSTPYYQELFAAGSIPLSILLLSVIIYILIKKDVLSIKSEILLGFSAGLLAMNRFDFLVAGFVLGFVVWGNSRKQFSSIFLFIGTYLITISPWIIYSIYHYSRPFVTDHQILVLSAIPFHITNYIIEPVPTIFDEPFRWVVKTGIGVITSLSGLKILGRNILFMLMSFMVLFWIVASFFNGISIPQIKNKVVLRKLLQMGLVILFIEFSVVLTGMSPARYYLPILLYANLMLLYILNHILNRPLKMRRKYAKYLYLSFILTIGFIPIYYVLIEHAMEKHHLSISYDQSNLEPIEYDEFTKYLKEEHDPRILVLDRYEVPPFKFGVLTGYRTYLQPFNLDSSNINELIKERKITHLLGKNIKGNNDLFDVILRQYNLLDLPTSTVAMYKIQPK